MKKLRLEIDDLSIESFAADEATEPRGTVGGRNEPPFTESCGGTCVNSCVSCVNTCLNTCPNSCWDTCYTCQTCEHHCTDPILC